MFKNLQNCLFGAKEAKTTGNNMHRTNHRLMSNIHKEQLLERAAGRAPIEPLISNSGQSDQTRTRNKLHGSKFVTEEPRGFSNMHKVREYTTANN